MLEVESRRAFASQGVVTVLGTSVRIVNTVIWQWECRYRRGLTSSAIQRGVLVDTMSASSAAQCVTLSLDDSTTVDSLITHTPRDRPKGMRYEGVCVIGEVDLYGSEI